MGGIAEALESLHTYFQENFLDFIGFLLTVIGGGFALLQWRASIKTNSADYVEKLLSKVMDDEQILEFQRLTDYGRSSPTTTSAIFTTRRSSTRTSSRFSHTICSRWRMTTS